MRLLLFALLFAGCEDEAATTPPPPPAATQSARQHKDCRDACEQANILAHGTDAELWACRARCDGHATGAAPHEVPSRITRSAPVARPPAVKPITR